MKPLELDQKAEDYLMLTQAAELLRDDRWVPHFSKTESEMCILQALAKVKFPEDSRSYYRLTTPPPELARLCRLRLEDNRMLKLASDGFCTVFAYNDNLCESGEEASIILEQAAELVLLREQAP